MDTRNDEDLMENDETLDSTMEPESQAFNFNPDPHWQEHALTYERMVQKIATKYCSSDEALLEDVMQECRIAVACIRPEDCAAFEGYTKGEITEEQWHHALNRYINNVIRNAALSMLDSYPKGNWYIGRTRSMKDRKTGETRKVFLPPRYSSLDYLVDEHGMQVDERGAISWPSPSDDGLMVESFDSTVHKHFGTRKWWVPTPEDIDLYAPKETEDE